MAPKSARNFKLLLHWVYFYLRGVVRPQGKLGGPKVAAVTQE